MLCLQGHILIPAGQPGILAAAGILYSLAASLFFIPAVVSMLPKVKPIAFIENGDNKGSILNRILEMFGRVVTNQPRGIILGSLLFALVTGMGIGRMSINTDPIHYYEKNHQVTISANLINQNLGGFFPISIVFEGDMKDPRLLKKIDSFPGPGRC